MTTYITLLRGINVSGQKVIKMSDLCDMYRNLGYQNVRSYIQTGNVIFTDESSQPEQLKANISEQIKCQFDFIVSVFIFSLSELQQIVNAFPYSSAEIDSKKLYLTFLSCKKDEKASDELLKLQTSGEELQINGKVISIKYKHTYGKSKLNNNSIEKLLKCKATTRNLHTIKCLLELAKN